MATQNWMAVADCWPQSAQPVHLYRVINTCNSLKQVHLKMNSVLSCYQHVQLKTTCLVWSSSLKVLSLHLRKGAAHNKALREFRAPPSCSCPREAPCLWAHDPPPSAVTQWLPTPFSDTFPRRRFSISLWNKVQTLELLKQIYNKTQITSKLVFCGFFFSRKHRNL